MELKVVGQDGEEELERRGYLMEARRRVLESQGYRLVGNHSAIKTCQYCRAAVKGSNVCYKNTFYGVASWRCIQATVTLDFCNLRCQWCWRDIAYTFPRNSVFNDDPEDIFVGFIREHRRALSGFGGDARADKKRLAESLEPRHVALSLTGDACMYPRLPELVDVINGGGLTSFVVTNGTFPGMVARLVEHQPTQLYVTLPAPDEETYLRVCLPFAKDGWQKIKKSLRLLKRFDRSVLRLTLAKGWNFQNPEGYAGLINSTGVDFVELKSAMPVGYALFRMQREQMVSHEEIKGFAKELETLTDFKMVDEKEDSRVVLMTRSGSADRFLGID